MALTYPRNHLVPPGSPGNYHCVSRCVRRAFLGRFWEGRFKCQALLDENAVLAAMAYVDLNQVRAALCDTLEDSDHSSARQRLRQHQDEPATGEIIAPIAGVAGQCELGISAIDYLQMNHPLTLPAIYCRP